MAGNRQGLRWQSHGALTPSPPLTAPGLRAGGCGGHERPLAPEQVGGRPGGIGLGAGWGGWVAMMERVILFGGVDVQHVARAKREPCNLPKFTRSLRLRVVGFTCIIQGHPPCQYGSRP